MAILKIFTLFATLFACSLAAPGTSGFGDELTARQDQGPCVRCCRLQRRFDRTVRNFEAEQADLDAARVAFREARTALEDAQAALSVNADLISDLRRTILDGRVEVNRLLADIDDRGQTPDETRALRAQLRSVREDIRTARAELREAREDKPELELVVEDAANEVGDRREDRSDERRMFIRARNRRDRSEARLERCLNRFLVTPTPEPEDPTMTPTPEPEDPTMTPTPEPEDPTMTPTPEPEDPTMTPTPEPEDPTMTPTPEPEGPTIEPTPEPTGPTMEPTPEPIVPSMEPTPEPIVPSVEPTF